MRKRIEHERSSGNVFADLGLDDANELQARGQIGIHLVALLKSKRLKQRQIAALLGIKQAEVSHLLNGHFSRFSVDKMFQFLNRLDQTVIIQISQHKRGEPYQCVSVS